MAKKTIKTNNKPVSNNGPTFATVGWATGIASVATMIFGITGFILGIISIVFSTIPLNKKLDEKSLKRAKQGQAMGIAGLVISVLFIILWAILASYIAWKYIVW